MEITVNVNVSAPELAAALNNLATAMGGQVISTGVIGNGAITKSDKKNSKPPKAEKEPDKTEETAQQEPEPTITFEEVRGKLAELTRAGKPVKELINKFGASKLSEIPPEKFAEVLKEAEGL